MRAATVFRFLCILPALLLAAKLAAAGPAVIEKVGTVSLTLPAPDGFSDPRAVSTDMRKLGEAFTPSNNRMLAFFVTDSDFKKAASGQQVDLDRYFAVHVYRQIEGATVSPAEFE